KNNNNSNNNNNNVQIHKLMTTTTTTITKVTKVTYTPSPQRKDGTSPSPSQSLSLSQQSSSQQPIPFDLSPAHSQSSQRSQVIVLDEEHAVTQSSQSLVDDEDDVQLLTSRPSTTPTSTTTTTTTTTSPTSNKDDNSDDAESINGNNYNGVRYYVNDFTTVTTTVYNRDMHLFEKDELDLIDRFLNVLSDDAKHLFVRLYNRKGPWFLVGSISYREIKDFRSSIEELVDCQLFVEYNSAVHDYNEISPLLPVAAIRKIIGVTCPSNAGKPELVELLRGKSPARGQSTLFQTTSSSAGQVESNVGRCVRIPDSTISLWRMIHHLFFFNWQQHNSTSMIVNNIMGIRFPDYQIWTGGMARDGKSIFETRESLLQYEQVKEVEERFDFFYDSKEENNVVPIIEECARNLSTMTSTQQEYTFALKFTPGWVWTRVLSSGVSILERAKQYEQAIFHLMQLIDLPFCAGKRGHWWQRLVINMKHLGKMDDALIICERSLNDPQVKSGDRIALENHYLMLATVEGAALDHYQNHTVEKWTGIHCETTIFLNLFVVFFWDIIFSSDIPHVFQSPFQDAPLDFGSDEFYFVRKEQIDARIQQLTLSTWQEREEMLETVWNKNNGCIARCVNWDKWPLDELKGLSKYIGGGLIAYCSKLMAEDFGCFSKGMPDLLLWRRNTEDLLEEKYFIKFVEVKGAGDSVRNHQKVWMDMLLSFGCDVDICHVKNK
ncbi:hypothetical protein SAMD00019534_065680, partial [Acytostelium subglobosum LB1]|uniref:hypothetical protein n=1 Tax=Acytostelium subglobosum LB1 TaxID=1410327 RepID=UPI000644FFEF